MYLTGVGSVAFQASEPQLGKYGAQARFFYGAWDWEGDFGVTSNPKKLYPYVYAVARLTQECFTDLHYGRIDKTFFAKGAEETVPEFFERVSDALFRVKRELAVIQRDFETLLDEHAPAVQSDPYLRRTVGDTILALEKRAANATLGIGWVVEEVDTLREAILLFGEASRKTRNLIERLGRSVAQAGVRDRIINQLKNNTSRVMDTYGAFYGQERRAQIQGHLKRIDELEIELEGGNGEFASLSPEQATEHFRQRLAQSAQNIEQFVDDMWNENNPVFEMALRLKAVFGGLSPDEPSRIDDPEYFTYEVVNTIASFPSSLAQYRQLWEENEEMANEIP